MDDWVESRMAIADPPPEPGLHLTARGVSYVPDLVRQYHATWAQVFGVALLAQPDRLFILAPRRPPEPPWFEVTVHDLRGDLSGRSLRDIAEQVRERMEQSSYRDRGPARPPLGLDELFARILRREEVPGALEVPVGSGPGGWWRRTVDLVASGSAGGVVGFYAGALSGSAMLATGAALAGALTGASMPVLVGANWRTMRGRRRRPRVLVLAPDGCVVGLPMGPKAFDWASIARFEESLRPPVGEPYAPHRPFLELHLSSHAEPEAIDGAWFGEPLPLIVSVAEAYRRRRTGRT